ncbi:TPA: hypothetical protein ACXNIY_002924 [Stenotrophomonas maltophilia]
MPRAIAFLDVEVLRIDRVEQRLEAAQPPAFRLTHACPSRPLSPSEQKVNES